MKKTLILLLLFWSFLIQASDASRTVLALWNSSLERSGNDYAHTYLHQKLEVVFNYYGLKLTFHDLALGLPPKDLEYKGIVTWFSQEGIPNSLEYGKWLASEMGRGKKVLILGELGFVLDGRGQAQNMNVVNNLLKNLGIEVTETFYDNPLLSSIATRKGPEYVEFERSLEGEIPTFRHVINLNPKNETWLSIQTKGQGKPSAVIVVGERGGFVQEGFVLFTHPQDNRTSWRVNPFFLVEKIFVDKTLPIPDVTTLNGKRVFFSHIDGDGFLGTSEIDRSATCGDIILKEIIQKYPYPITASVILAEMDSSLAATLARKIFAHPNVEPASHTLSHPLSWLQKPTALEVKNYLGEKARDQGPILSYKKKNPTLDYSLETSGSIDFLNRTLVPPGKKAEIVLWSGSCRPPEEALKPLAQHHFLNMNGGDSRMDALYNTYSHLSGLYRKQGSYLQVYSANANENIYTDLWSPPYSGFRDVIQTFEKTESPIRIKPVNAYFHYYSGQFFSSLKSLQDIFTWVGTQDLNPIRASEYIHSVEGFAAVEVEKKGENLFRIKNHGALKTLRLFERKLLPDYKHSQNIVGHKIFQNQLYVFLGPLKDSLLKLTATPQAGPYLVSANGSVLGVKEEKSAVTYKLHSHLPLKAQFWAKGKLKEMNLARGTSEVRVER
jgi:polysaccharide biosynthesis protein PelA